MFINYKVPNLRKKSCENIKSFFMGVRKFPILYIFYSNKLYIPSTFLNNQEKKFLVFDSINK